MKTKIPEREELSENFFVGLLKHPFRKNECSCKDTVEFCSVFLIFILSTGILTVSFYLTSVYSINYIPKRFHMHYEYRRNFTCDLDYEFLVVYSSTDIMCADPFPGLTLINFIFQWYLFLAPMIAFCFASEISSEACFILFFPTILFDIVFYLGYLARNYPPYFKTNSPGFSLLPDTFFLTDDGVLYYYFPDFYIKGGVIAFALSVIVIIIASLIACFDDWCLDYYLRRKALIKKHQREGNAVI